MVGAAVAGPVGKIAGSFAGKTVAKCLIGDGKDKDKKVETAEAAPSADDAAIPTAESAAGP